MARMWGVQGGVLPRGQGWRTRLINASSRHFPPVAAAGKWQVDLMDKRLGAGRREAELVLSVGGEEGWLSNCAGTSQNLHPDSCFLEGDRKLSKG